MPATTRRIDPVKSVFEFTVEGKGTFPIDMLRYDSCWPASEGRDVPEISLSAIQGRQHQHRVTLIGLREPTVGRWESFGWRVV